MTDSYGDGWNGYSFSFVQNGITLSTETIASGGSGTATIALCDNVAVDVVIETAGSYAGEISFDVIDPFGANVATLSPGSLAGAAGTVVATFTAVCTAPACPDPLGLTASNVTANSADISWIDQALSGVSNVEYGTAGFVLGTGTAITGTTDTTANLAGLTTATTYEFYVQSDCGTDQSSWSGPFAFTTSFNAPDGVVCSGGSAAFIFTDDLEANTGWTGDIGSGAGQWDFPTAFPGGNSTGTGPSGPASGTTFAEYEASGSQALPQW